MFSMLGKSPKIKFRLFLGGSWWEPFISAPPWLRPHDRQCSEWVLTKSSLKRVVSSLERQNKNSLWSAVSRHVHLEFSIILRNILLQRCAQSATWGTTARLSRVKLGADFWEGDATKHFSARKRRFSVKRGEAIQWMRGLVRISTGRVIQWRGPGHSVNRQTLKTEKLLSSSASRKSALKEWLQRRS